MLQSSVRRSGGGGIIDKMIPGYQEKIWAALPAAYKSYKVNGENSGMETHVKNHKRYQGLILWWKESIEKGLKPSAKYRVNKVSWRLQELRGTLHVGRWYEGPNGSDYRPGNTEDRLTNTRAPFSDAEWQERKNYRSYDIMKLGYGLLGIFLVYRAAGEWPVVWCDDRKTPTAKTTITSSTTNTPSSTTTTTTTTTTLGAAAATKVDTPPPAEEKPGDKVETLPPAKIETMIFQLGTNNWQRPMTKNGKDGELEFAPGSGVLHEAHHNAYNVLPGIKSYSMYPSENQGQPTEADADYRVFELDHPIPICESASPNSSKRWHAMDDAEFNAYVQRLENEVYDYMKTCEETAGMNFTSCIAHHSFINPLVLSRVIKRRTAEGIPKCPLYCFVHGTALKMYRWELGPKETPEQKTFPMRFHKMICDEKLFDDQVYGVNACFVISAEQKGGIQELFPTFPQDRVIIAPNGINVEKFKAQPKGLDEVVLAQTRKIIWPAAPPSEEDCKKYKRVITFVGKFAEWKRQAALLHAAAQYEKEFPDVVTLCVGTGPDAEADKLKKLAAELGLKNTFLLGARAQDVLAELYTVSSIGCFPSFKEPFGLVFVECMACKTPVIGANSGGPKDFVSTDVGELVAEPPETKDLSTVAEGVVTLGGTLNEAISRALNEDWKKTKGDACLKLALDKFTVNTQVTNMLKDSNKLFEDFLANGK